MNGDTQVINARRGARTLALVLPLVVLAAAAPARAAPAGAEALTASITTIDGNGGGGGRTDATYASDTAAVAFGGAPHVFSYDATHGDLRHAWRTSAGWRFETVDGAGGAGGRRAADVGRTVSAVATATAIDVFYVDSTAGDLRHAHWVPQQGWRFATLDGAGGAAGRVTGSVGGGSSAAVIGGALNVFYADGTRKDVRRAVQGPQGWTFSVLDGAGGPGGRSTRPMGGYTRVVVAAGVPHVFYTSYDTTDQDVGFAWGYVRDARLSAGTWQVEQVGRFPWPYSAELTAQYAGGALLVGLGWRGLNANTFATWVRTGTGWTATAQLPCADDPERSCLPGGFVPLGGRAGALVSDVLGGPTGAGALQYSAWTGSAWTAPEVVDRSGSAVSSVRVGTSTWVFYLRDGDLRAGTLA